MPFRAPSRRSSVLASMLGAAGLVLAVASCSNITPLGPTPEPAHGAVQSTPVGVVDKLGSPIILQVMRSESPTTTGACPTGSIAVSLPPGAAPMPCFRPVGTPVTITTAAVSSVSPIRQGSAPGQPAPPVSYGFMVDVVPAQAPAVTALIQQAYDSRAALGVTVDGKLWEAAQVLQAFPGQQLQLNLLSRNRALQLYGLLV